MTVTRAEQTFADALWRDSGGVRGPGSCVGIPRTILAPDESVHVLVRDRGDDRFTDRFLILTDRRILLCSDRGGTRWTPRSEVPAPLVTGARRVPGGPFSTDNLEVLHRGQVTPPLKLRFTNPRSATEFIATLDMMMRYPGPLPPVMEASGGPPTPAERSFLAAVSRTVAGEPYRYRHFAPVYRDILTPDEVTVTVVCDSAAYDETRLLVLTDRRLLQLTDGGFLDWRVRRHGDVPRADVLSARTEVRRLLAPRHRLIVEIRDRKPVTMTFDLPVDGDTGQIDHTATTAVVREFLAAVNTPG